MIVLIAGLAIFFGPHLFSAWARGPREALVGKIGELPYKGLYSLISLAGFVLIVIGWRDAGGIVLYAPPDWMRWPAYLLMAPALVLIVAAYAPPGRIAAAVKHPMLAAVKFWALAHLLVNGELRSLVLFGAFLAYAVVDRIAVKNRGAATPTAGPVRNDFIAILGGVIAYIAIFFYLHPYIAGVALVH